MSTEWFRLAVATAALALGVAILTGLHAVRASLRPDVPELRGLVGIAERIESWPAGPVSSLNFREWREAGDLFQGLAAYTPIHSYLTGDGRPEILRALRVSADFFTVLGVEAILGRAELAPAEDDVRLAVLSHGLWVRRYGGDPYVVRRYVRLGGTPYRVLGVAPRGFAFPPGDPPVDLWVFPLPQLRVTRGSDDHVLGAVARLAPGVTPEKAAARLDELHRRIAEAYPEAACGHPVRVTPLADHFAAPFASRFTGLRLASGFVLFLAWTSAVAVLLARGAFRRESSGMALATGLGVGLAAGLLGLFLTTRATDSLPALSQLVTDGAPEVGSVAGFSLALGILAGALLALPLVVQARRSRRDGFGVHFVLLLAVALEAFVATGLLVSAGLARRSVGRLGAVDLGFAVENKWSFGLPHLPSRGTLGPSFGERLLEKIEGLPGVETAALTDPLPLGGSYRGVYPVLASGGEPVAGSVYLYQVSSGFFSTLGIPLLQGRAFHPRDGADSVPVVIVSRKLAEASWPGESAVGQRLGWSSPGRWREVVGVVGDVRLGGLDLEPDPAIYVPISQSSPRRLTVVLGTTQSLEEPAVRQLEREIERVVWSLDDTLPIESLRPMSETVRRTYSRLRRLATVLGTSAVVLVLVTAAGLYGVTALAARRSRHLFGMRMAAEDGPTRTFFLVIEALALAAATLGLAGIWGFVLARSFASLVFGTTAWELAVALGGAAVLLLSVTLGASLVGTVARLRPVGD